MRLAALATFPFSFFCDVLFTLGLCAAFLFTIPAIYFLASTARAVWGFGFVVLTLTVNAPGLR